ncbi:MAG: phage tail protein I [Desulfovibrio sp.]|nr:phage tail protein I [Desulfovibrio sp.]
MYRLGQKGFAQVVSHSIREDAQIQAAVEALDGLLAQTAQAIPNLLLPSRLAHDLGDTTTDLLPPFSRLVELAGGLQPLSEELLDLLAWQFHVDGYEMAQTVEAKRRLIMQSLPWHRIKGTPAAVRMLLEALGIRIDIIEWWTAEGRSLGMPPYTFAVRGWIGEPLRPNELYGPDTVADMKRAIEMGKNVRSHLWRITLAVELEIPFRAGFRLLRRRSIDRHRFTFSLRHRFDHIAADAVALDHGSLGHSTRSRQRHVFCLPRASSRPERGLDRFPHFDRVRADFAPLDMAMEVANV